MQTHFSEEIFNQKALSNVVVELDSLLLKSALQSICIEV